MPSSVPRKTYAGNKHIMSKRILYVRSLPYDFNMDLYNVQEIGLGKAFCKLGYNFDLIVLKKKNQRNWTFFEHNGCRAKCIEMPRIRFLRWGINLSICKKEFLEQYDYVICSEYMQIMSYLLSRNAKKMFIYNGPYRNPFMFKIFSPIYDLLFTKAIKRNISQVFTKSILSENFLRSKSYENITTVGVGLDRTRFDNDSSMEKSTQDIVDYMKSHECLLYIGSICERKNFK